MSVSLFILDHVMTEHNPVKCPDGEKLPNQTREDLRSYLSYIQGDGMDSKKIACRLEIYIIFF